MPDYEIKKVKLLEPIQAEAIHPQKKEKEESEDGQTERRIDTTRISCDDCPINLRKYNT